MLQKFPVNQKSGTKMPYLFFFRELQLIRVLLLICNSQGRIQRFLKEGEGLSMSATMVGWRKKL